MPNANSVVDNVRRLSSTLADIRQGRQFQQTQNYVTVEFQSGAIGRLDMGQPRSVVWAEVLHSLREAQRPAYVEIDPASGLIIQLLYPLLVRVGRIQETQLRAEVELIISHARHYVQRTRPNFRELLDALKDAARRHSNVWVTETDDHHIVDVRPALGGDQRRPVS
jgi:hypothetical protein